MAYWRMQLHPDRIERAASFADESLKRGFIGLDFRTKVGDLSVSHEGISKGQLPYRFFQSELAIGDLVLIQVGSKPFALVEVAGDYEYVEDPIKERGVWFKHMRRITNVRRYEELLLSGEPSERIPFRSTLMRVRAIEQPAHRLIDRWSNLS